MKIRCSVSEVDLEGDYGDVEGVQVTCGKCGHTTESFGTGDGSVKRCLSLMREECPNGQNNFYVQGD